MCVWGGGGGGAQFYVGKPRVENDRRLRSEEGRRVSL